MWLKPRPHQQQCRSNVANLLPKTATMSNEFIVKFLPFDKFECCFDIVAIFDNIVEGNFVLSTNSAQIEHVQFVFRVCRKYEISFDSVVTKQQQCRSNIRLCWKNRSTCSIRQYCFDIVAGVDGLQSLLKKVLSVAQYLCDGWTSCIIHFLWWLLFAATEASI